MVAEIDVIEKTNVDDKKFNCHQADWTPIRLIYYIFKKGGKLCA